MSVLEQLGVADLAGGLAEARHLWTDWVDQDSRLAAALYWRSSNKEKYAAIGRFVHEDA